MKRAPSAFRFFVPSYATSSKTASISTRMLSGNVLVATANRTYRPREPRPPPDSLPNLGWRLTVNPQLSATALGRDVASHGRRSARKDDSKVSQPYFTGHRQQFGRLLKSQAFLG